MSNTCIIKKSIVDPNNNLIIISEITLAENSVSRPRNTLLVNSYRMAPGGSELSIIDKCILPGKDYGIQYRNVSIINGPDDYHDYKLIVCGLDKNKFDHDPDRLFVYVLDRQLNIVRSIFRYTHEKHHKYNISSHIISDDKHLIRVVRERGSVTEIDFYLN